MTNKIKQAGLAVLVAVSLTGCMSDLTGTTYSSGEARQMQVVRFGTVAEARFVKLQGTEGEVGTLAGGATGAVLGSQIGGRNEGIIGGIAGAVAGGVLGNMAEKKLTTKQGIEITVRLEDGSYVSVVQQHDPAATFNAGDRVKVLTQGTTSRVVRVQ
ncbi:glycine zipper 2TM domain-containing protein [Endozoicomonas montiporae]|uniref:Putative outer membrane protein SlyB n=1 Tax=Endozoicomonas montiporae CL-33 TaxID=570277 RepID=A0A142BF41_9GAMM|nr:glycine zipper 2TM domain-containing protein [Endozoicomonas montiporae]AMO57367.1 putative outer membrane protein SlyB [Endozoicomonas montiporae CL-33]